MGLTIRSMQHEDLDSVYAIEIKAHKTPWSKEILRDCFFVGYNCQIFELHNHDSDAVVVGYSIARFNNTAYHLLNFCIAPQWQNKGLGSQFLTRVLQDLTQHKNIDHVLLEVRPSNKIAINLYARMGFVVIDCKKDYYKDLNGTEDAWLMKKAL